MESYDQLRVLQWLRDKERETSLVHDSDMMRGLGFTAEQVQAILLALQARGDVEFKNILLERGQAYTFTKIRLKKSGHARLERATDPEPAEPPRRFITWFKRRR